MIFFRKLLHKRDVYLWIMNDGNRLCGYEQIWIWTNNSKLLAFIGIFGLSEFLCKGLKQSFSNETSPRSLKFSIETVIEGVDPVFTDKREIGYRERKTMRFCSYWHNRIVTPGLKSKKFKSSSPVKTERFRLRTCSDGENRNWSQLFWKTMNWNIEIMSKLRAVLWLAPTIRIPMRKTKWWDFESIKFLHLMEYPVKPW